jgi:hypothetical protein
MADIDERLGLIAADGAVYFPYKKNQRQTGRFGFALTRPGEGDRHGKGTYTTDIAEVIRRVVLEGWNVRAQTSGIAEKKREGSLGLGKRTIVDYWVADEFKMLVAGASKKPVYQRPDQARTLPKDPLPEALERATRSGNREEERVLREILTRRGQPKFRSDLLKSYKGRCCVTACDVEAVLEAAHIVGHAEEANYAVTNGMLLRADIHTLFDIGLLTVDTEYKVRVSGVLSESEYGSLDGKRIELPDDKKEWPHLAALAKRAL